jgi:polyphosphate glucokinase
MAKKLHPLGIDIGGSGIKGAPVDLDEGVFATERLRIETPKESTPDAVADIVEKIADHFKSDTKDSPVGVTIPGVVTHGMVRTAANIDKSWIGTDAEAMLSSRLGRPMRPVWASSATAPPATSRGSCCSPPSVPGSAQPC